MSRPGFRIPSAAGPASPVFAAVRALLPAALAVALAAPSFAASPPGVPPLGAAPPPDDSSALAAATSPGGPHLLLDVYDAPAEPPSAEVALLESFGDGLALFAAADPRHGREPWVTDGTPAGTVRLGDLAPGPEDSLQSVPPSASTAERAFFLTGDELYRGARALWTTDGTPAGTVRLLDDLLALPAPDRPTLLADGAGRVFLLAADRQQRPGLWVTDGTPAGTRRLPHPGLPGRQPGELVAVVGGRVLLRAGTGIGGTQELWSSDGTAAGTRRLLPGNVAGPPYDDPHAGALPSALHVAVLDEGVAVVLQKLGQDGAPEGMALALWRTDGTPAGTVRNAVLPDRVLIPGSLVGGPQAAFLTRTSASGYEVWLSDGSGGFATRVVHQGDPSAWNFRWLEGRLFFTSQASPEPLGEDLLWVADPVAGPARIVTRLPGFVAGRWMPFRNGLAFVLTGEDRQDTLWWSDGTEGGTAPVAPLGEPHEETYWNHGILGVFDVAGEELLFLRSESGLRTWALHVSDGTAAGTRVLGDGDWPLPRGDLGTSPWLLPVRGGVLFAVDGGGVGREPWTTDGTPRGTELLVDVASPVGNGDSWPRDFTRYGDRLLFFARSPDHWGLWETDGTAAGTERLHEVFFTPPPGSTPRFSGPQRLALVGDLLFFTVPAEDPFVLDLKVADLAAGQVRHLGRFDRPSGPAVAADGRLVWAAQEQRVVVSDGTVEGTRRLPLWTLPTFQGLLALPDGTALVVAERRLPDGSWSDRGLWRTDGTAAGTSLVLQASDTLVPNHLTLQADGTVYFSLYFFYSGSGPGEVEGGLWRTDGTPEGTELVQTFGGLLPSRLAAAEVGLFFVLHGPEGSTLWLLPAEGGEARPVRGTTAEGLPIRWVSWTLPFGPGILFSANDVLHGSEVWVSDGTEAGTRRLGDPTLGNLLPGALSAPPEQPVMAAGRAWFEHLGRLWHTDGTRRGTFAVFGPPLDERPPVPTVEGRTVLDEMALLGERLVLAAHTLRAGREPWVLPTASPVALEPPPPLQPPPAPTGLTARSEVGGVVLGWTSAVGEGGFFRVEARSPDRPEYRNVEDVPVHGARLLRHFWTVEGLPPGVPHDFRVRLVNPAGASPPSAPATGSILPGPVEPCAPSPTSLCLLGGRFRVSVWWRDRRSGDTGRGFAVPFPGTDLTGTFWFFQEGNVELIVKALDGTPVNRRWWLFTGGLTDVEYWLRVVDTELEAGRGLPAPVEWYHHRSGDLCGFADTDAFPGEPGSFFPRESRATAAEPVPEHLDLLGDRYRVRVDWRDPGSGDAGTGRAIPGTGNTGYFWFFREGNVEVVVKVLDGVPVNGHRWVFWGGLTGVEYTLHVTDLWTGATREYHHPPGDLCGGADTAAFREVPP